jgi:FG-GAP-like repeat
MGAWLAIAALGPTIRAAMMPRACLPWLTAVLASCAGPAPDGALGVAGERVVDPGWKIVQGVDFNHDGMGDALWYEPATNRFAVWLMDGERLLAPGPVIPGPVGDGWSAVIGWDFNDDGMADVLWFNADTGTIAIWLMDGTEVLAPGPEIPGPGDGWAAVTAGDFNGDGMADVLWSNTGTGEMAVWLMDGVHVLARGPEIPGPAGDGWFVVTAADFNHDGMNDVLWIDTGTNRFAVWLMDGTEVLAPGPAIPEPAGDGWIATTAADFNDDGMADVLWSNAGTDQMAVWLMDGTRVLAPGPAIPGPAGDGWIAITAVDTNLDGMADVMWSNSGTDQMAMWLMDGTQILASGPVIPGPGG